MDTTKSGLVIPETKAHQTVDTSTLNATEAQTLKPGEKKPAFAKHTSSAVGRKMNLNAE